METNFDKRLQHVESVIHSHWKVLASLGQLVEHGPDLHQTFDEVARTPLAGAARQSQT